MTNTIRGIMDTSEFRWRYSYHHWQCFITVSHNHEIRFILGEKSGLHACSKLQ